MIDMILIVLVEVVVIFAMLLVMRAFGDDPVSKQASAWVIAIFGLVTWLFFWGYYVFFEMLWNGQSPGKRWVGLRVIREGRHADHLIRIVHPQPGPHR